MYQQLWGYKVEVKLYLAEREQKRLNTTDLDELRIQMVNEGNQKGKPTRNTATS
jgi:hypothetical protein